MLGRTSTPALAVDLAVAITRIRARLRKEQHAVTHGRTSHLNVLGRISEQQPITASEIAAAEHIRQQSVAETARVLLNEGLIQAEAHPTDRRKVLLSLTPKGVDFVDSIQAYRGAWLAQAIEQHVTADELDTLERSVVILSRLASCEIKSDES